MLDILIGRMREDQHNGNEAVLDEGEETERCREEFKASRRQ